ncbi:MAG: ferredoxin reductase [Ketobacteraceae bacterium]|nr:ferredoxin reductase [Ketobacteraceae bacterium]
MTRHADALQSIRRWVSKALFNTDSAGSYFEPLAEGIDPMWSLQSAQARVERIYRETSDTLTLTVQPNTRFPGFSAGQHVQLSVEINGARKTRTFTIASSPGEWRRHGKLQLTIKAVPRGQVTNWIHEHVKPGHFVRLQAPAGEFLLPTQPANTLYIAGGSGITPIMSHIRELMESQFPYPVTLLYYAKRRDEIIFRAELEAIANHFKQFKLYLICTQERAEEKQLNGHLCQAHLDRALTYSPEHVFVCGPNALREAAEGLTTESYGDQAAFHAESFGLLIKRPSGDTCAQPVTLTKSRKTIDCNPGTPLLEAAEQNGLTPNYGCRMGICYTCKCRKTSGVVRNALTGKLSGTDEEDIQLCISIPETAVEIDL